RRTRCGAAAAGGSVLDDGAAIRPRTGAAVGAAPRLLLAAVGPNPGQSFLGAARHRLVAAIGPFPPPARRTPPHAGLAVGALAARALRTMPGDALAVGPFAGRALGAFSRSGAGAVRPHPLHALGAHPRGDVWGQLRLDRVAAGLTLRRRFAWRALCG